MGMKPPVVVSLPSSEPKQPQGWSARIRWRWLVLTAVGGLLFFAAVLIFPRIFGLYYGYNAYKTLFYDELHFSGAQSQFLAVAASFWTAMFWVPMVWLTIKAIRYRRRPQYLVLMFALWIFLYGTMPLLRMTFWAGNCFAQTSDQPLQWFTRDVSGKLVFFDSPGFDQNGNEKEPVTVEICNIAQAQREGIAPHEIVDDPASVAFFDPQGGNARVWFARREDGIHLFDAPGFDPTDGQLLSVITPAVVDEVKAQAAARAEQQRAEAEAAKAAAEEARKAAEAKAREEAERAKAEAAAAQAAAEAKARKEAERAKAQAEAEALNAQIAVFAPDSYPAGVVIIGVVPQKADDSSTQAANGVESVVTATVRGQNREADVFRPAVYSNGYFSTLLAGDDAILDRVGLAKKIRAAILASVEATCRRADVAGVTTCSISAHIRVVEQSGAQTVHDIAGVGAGSTQEGAIAGAVDRLRDSLSQILKDV